MRRVSFTHFFLTIGFVVSSCATYYQSNLTFNHEFEQGNLEDAYRTLQKESSKAHGKDELLYFFNCGVVLSMLGRYEESNEFLEKAYLFGEDYRINYMNEAATYLINPMVGTYRGEDHEHLLVLYYKALNYLKMKKTDDALVECRRLSTRLQQLSDRYQSTEKYEHDAFIHLLMGIIYETDHDYNNAFIAYRNSYQVYQDDFARLFGLHAPPQLHQDLLRTAFLSGLTDEVEKYKTEFGISDYQYKPAPGGELVFFWHNGLAPIKIEWGVDFIISERAGVVFFTNDQLGLNFSFPIEDEKQRKGLLGLEVFRVAFPKYAERPLYFSDAEVTINDSTYQLHTVEDVNAIAFKCLQERMVIEFGKALIRLALKKVEEHEVKKENEALGELVGLFNAVTEKADTRNWQTLPHTIAYTRVPLPEGQSTIHFMAKTSSGRSVDHPITVNIKSGQLSFHTFTSLETNYLGYSQ